jgi:hypothetical protein
MDKYLQRSGRWLGWISAILVVLMLITGYGVTENRLFNMLTFGVWNKAIAQQWHVGWIIPVLLMLSLTTHIIIAETLRRRRNNH